MGRYWFFQNESRKYSHFELLANDPSRSTSAEVSVGAVASPGGGLYSWLVRDALKSF